MGSGKAFDVLKHLFICDNIDENNTGFYAKIVYADSVGEDEETYSAFKKALKTPIVKVPPNKRMDFVNEHIRS
ncbi:MAG: hypothetical protein Ta2E_11200 [Mycoplasmoidaceae bacterium]|nr:MAG: hypothetical protein Ta2E_11200 [Mycoplasmoidaceae bacterium]